MEYGILGQQARIGHGASVVPGSPSYILDGISGIEQNLSDIHNAIEAIEQRLVMVLTPVAPSASTDSAKQAAQPTSHLRGRVVLLNDGLSAAVNRLQHLLGRIEI